MGWDAEDSISWVSVRESVRRRDADHNPTMCVYARVCAYVCTSVEEGGEGQ